MRLFMALAAMLAMILPVHAEPIGSWALQQTDDTVEYFTENASGDKFVLHCKSGGKEHETSGRVVMGNGNPAVPAVVQFIIDGNPFYMAIDEQARLTTGCPMCAENFVALWSALRTGYELETRFPDGRTANFTLEGSGTVLPEEPCIPDYLFTQQLPVPRKKPRTDATPAIAHCTQLWQEDLAAQKACVARQIEAIDKVVEVSKGYELNQVYELILESCNFAQTVNPAQAPADWQRMHDCINAQIIAVRGPGSG